MVIKEATNPPLQITGLCLGELQTNCYIAWCKTTRECVVIDPADSAESITQVILDLQLKPLSIIFTHGHFDHVLGSLELYLNYSIPVFMQQNDAAILKNAQKSAQHWLKHSVDPVVTNTQPLLDGMTLSVGESTLEVIETPGHTPGSICLFVNQENPVLFTGDTLFKNGVGRTDFEYSSGLQLQKSLKKLFTTLPPQTLCYPGHGDSTLLVHESMQ